MVIHESISKSSEEAQARLFQECPDRSWSQNELCLILFPVQANSCESVGGQSYPLTSVYFCFSGFPTASTHDATLLHSRMILAVMLLWTVPELANENQRYS